jgi:imidazolonepropionase-like amidohydrolase
VDVGKDADLILVDGDPLADIGVLDRLALVLVRGVRPH